MSSLDAQHGLERCLQVFASDRGDASRRDMQGNCCRLLIDGSLWAQIHVDDGDVLTVSVLLSRPARELGAPELVAMLLNNQHGDRYPEIICAVDPEVNGVILNAKLKLAGLSDPDLGEVLQRMVGRAKAVERRLSMAA